MPHCHPPPTSQQGNDYVLCFIISAFPERLRQNICGETVHDNIQYFWLLKTLTQHKIVNKHKGLSLKNWCLLNGNTKLSISLRVQLVSSAGQLTHPWRADLLKIQWMKCGNHSMWMEMLGKETLGLRIAARQVKAKDMQSVSSASASSAASSALSQQE